MSETKYRAAKYIRLSYADDKDGESNSVENQRKLLDSFIATQPDIEVVAEKVDDGVSGIIFDRKAFKEMMAQIEAGEINCVIVKDLSRLGREYIETGRYLRRIFPAYNVRFIALNDNIDTLRDDADDLVVGVKSIINDAYSRDISVKTRSALNVKRDNGDYVGACPIYGYRRCEELKNQLAIDEYPASIVRDIFRMKIDGMSALKIAETLNSLGVLSPMEYKRDRGLPHPKGGFADKPDAKWSATAIFRILNDETYMGTLIQGRRGTLNYKIKDVIDKPESEWKRTENAHEAIISPRDFDLARRIMQLDTRTAPGGDKVYLFSGVLICGCCGGRMTRKTNRYKGQVYNYYYCPTGKKQGCSGAGMLREQDLGEVLKIACVMHKIYSGAGADFPETEPWYQAYLDYAVANGLVEAGELDLAAVCTRFLAAHLLSLALPVRELAEISDLVPPDVAPENPYYEEILLLYRAGILTGTDGLGTFVGDGAFTRAQGAAIAARLCEKAA